MFNESKFYDLLIKFLDEKNNFKNICDYRERLDCINVYILQVNQTKNLKK